MMLICDPSFECLTASLFDADGTARETHRIEMSPNPGTLAGKLKACVAGGAVDSILLRILFGGNDADRYATHPAYAALVGCAERAIKEAFPAVTVDPYYEEPFFDRLPEAEKRYAIPFKTLEGEDVRRPGFHGAYHAYAAMRFPDARRIVSIVFDRQTTVCSIRNGDPVSISLGNTPLEGIMGEENCGDIDPGILFVLMKRHGFSVEKMDSILKHESGFRGMTGYGLDIPQLASLYGKDPKVDLAFRVFQDHILRYIGEGLALMGGFDLMVLSGPYLSPLTPWFYHTLRGLSFLGIRLDHLPWKGPDGSGMSVATTLDSRIEVVLNHAQTASILFELQKRISL